MNMDKEIVDLFVDDIIPNRFQPREIFDEKALKELSDSIKEHGVIQPIIVRKIGDKYEIIAGERRYKASIMAGLTKIPAIIRNLDDKESSKVALLENLQRKDLSAIEEARTYQKILDLDSMTQEELGKTMGKSQAAIANKLRLLSLPDEIQEALLTNQISERHARSLLNVKDKEQQINLLNKIIENKMTVRELDAEIKNLTGETEPTPMLVPNEMPTSSTLEQTTPNEEHRFIPDMNPEVKPFDTKDKEISDIKSQSSDILANSTPQTMNIEQLLRVDSAPENPMSTPTTIPEAPKTPVEVPATPKIVEEPKEAYHFIPTFEEQQTEEDLPKPSIIPDAFNGTPKDNTNSVMDFIANVPLVTPEDEDETPTGGTVQTPVVEQPKPVQIDDATIDTNTKPTTIPNYQPFTNTESLLDEFRTKREPVETPAAMVTNPTPVIEKEEPVSAIPNLRVAINMIRDMVKKLEENGFVVNLDEMDFENKYQINISIDKNK